ncbi:MAG: alpha/beta hydrolase [Ktedonobacteraceae bacterium]|nr:alpha/beta hydrolase [Ktedonobacteraceae bacterium]
MPIVPVAVQKRVERFASQRWLLDAVIQFIGPEWDQSRLLYMSAPCSKDTQSAIMGLRATIKKYDDIAPEMTKAARRMELRAKQALQQGHTVTAGDHFFAASVLYGGAQWPIFDNTPFNLALGEKKNECYMEYIRLADHHVERVEIPYQGQTLAGYFHLPPGYSGGRLPCLVMVSGMDGIKEFTVSSSADRYLRRGFACLCLDGPGQGESLTRGIWYDPETYGECGTSAYEWVANRSEVDANRVMAFGVSFGSYWATQITAAEPRYAACAVILTCFEPQDYPLLEMASPTFKQRLMYMTGIQDEDAFDAMTEKLDVRPLSAKIRVPYLVIAGEDDELSDVGYTFEHLNHVQGPKTLVLYSGELHQLNTTRSGQLGPFGFGIQADWLRDRADGKPLDSEYIVVDSQGQLHSQPWGENRVYEYGAPLDFRHLFGDTPETGTA